MLRFDRIRFTTRTLAAVAALGTSIGLAQVDQQQMTIKPRGEAIAERANAREAERRLRAALESLWPDWSWTSRDSSSERGGEVVERAAQRSVLPESADAWLAGASALAARFGDEIEPGVASHFGFVDAEIPAPESWAVEARLRYSAEEARLLHRCVVARDSAEATSAASEFLRVRFRRVAASHDRDVAAWRTREMTHGLAAYAAYRSLLLIDSPREARTVAVALRRGMLSMLQDAAERPELLTPELTGFALAMSLDRTELAWHRLASVDHVSLDALLAGPPKSFGDR